MKPWIWQLKTCGKNQEACVWQNKYRKRPQLDYKAITLKSHKQFHKGVSKFQPNYVESKM